MKKAIYALTTLLLVSACGDRTTENTMTVSGTVKGLKKGTLYLQHIPDSTLVVVDSLEINGNGDFNFQTELDSPEIFYLYLSKEDNNDLNDRIKFFGEPGNIIIHTAWNSFDTEAKISGSKSHEKLNEFLSQMSRMNKRNLEILQSGVNGEIPLDSLQIDSINRASDRNTKRGYLYAINFAINNKDSYVAPYIAISEIANANPIYLDSINNALTPDVAKSKYGKKLKEHLANLKK